MLHHLDLLHRVIIRAEGTEGDSGGEKFDLKVLLVVP